MTNETFEPVGLLEITKQLADSAQAHVDRGRKQVADLEDRLHSALDAKRDVASNYVAQLDAIASEKEVEVKLDPFTDLIQTVTKTNDAVYMSGFETGYQKGYWKGYNAGRLHGELPLNEKAVHDEHLQSLNSMTEDEISQELVDAGYDVDELVESVQETIKANEK